MNHQNRKENIVEKDDWKHVLKILKIFVIIIIPNLIMMMIVLVCNNEFKKN